MKNKNLTLKLVLCLLGITTLCAMPLTATPTVINVDPPHGPSEGGNHVTISGTDFTNVSWIKFGSQEACFNVNSDFSITAIAPNSVENESNVKIILVNHKGEVSSPIQYSYISSNREL